MRNIVELSTGPEYELQAVFDTGESKRFDFKPLLRMEVFSELSNPDYFKQVINRGYFVEWPHEQDISADTIYIEGR